MSKMAELATTSGKTHYQLTSTQMAALEAISRDPSALNSDGEYFYNVVCDLWRMLLGEDCFADGKPSIDCTKHAIPEWQWKAISTMLVAKSSTYGRASVVMEWVNVGPSTYSPTHCDGTNSETGE